MVQSLKLPSNANVIITAISLIPNWQPTFPMNPFAKASVVAGQNYSASVATNATDLNGDTVTYGKAGGPAGLNIASNGGLSGLPLYTNVGTNSFTVSATDTAGLVGSATLNITVLPPPPIVPAFASVTATNIILGLPRKNGHRN